MEPWRYDQKGPDHLFETSPVRVTGNRTTDWALNTKCRFSLQQIGPINRAKQGSQDGQSMGPCWLLTRMPC